LASLAYTLIETIRRIGLKGTALANAYVGTICLKRALNTTGSVRTRKPLDLQVKISDSCNIRASA
jgi:hypothetical protein